MQADREKFWSHTTYAVVGDASKGRFPKMTYGNIKKSGRKVFAVDPSGGDVGGDPTYPDLAALPEPVEALVLEVPKAETAGWVAKAAEAGIGAVWIHQQTDTPEALALARDKKMEVCSGTCAVMYTGGGFPHSIHRGIMKLTKKF